MKVMQHIIPGVLGALSAALCCSGAFAADAYPSKPIRIVIGALPGSNTDYFFRTIQNAMGSALGQQLIADYRAGGKIGRAHV